MRGKVAKACRRLARQIAEQQSLPEVAYKLYKIEKKYTVNTASGPTVITLPIEVRVLDNCVRRFTKIIKRAHNLERRGILHAKS
jgi:hypothetical protein